MSTQRPASVVENLLGKQWGLSLALILILFVTRSNFVVENLHFAPWLRAPDATLAVFFLAALWIGSLPLFVVLLAAAALADQAAFASGVSAWCVTAAYVFLIPTYGVLWYGGHSCRNVDFGTAAGLGRLLSTLLLSTAVAWAISSGSFFLFSGYFTNMPAVDYFTSPGVSGHIPKYIGFAVFYALFGLGAAALWRSLKQPASAPMGQ